MIGLGTERIRQLPIHYFFKLPLKGTVLQKLTGVEIGINRKVFLLHRMACVLFLYFKGTCSLNLKKSVEAAEAKICGLSKSMGRPLEITDNGKPIS